MLIMNAKKIVAMAKHSRKTNIKLGSLFLNTVTPFTCVVVIDTHHFYVDRMRRRHEIPVNSAEIKKKLYKMILIKQQRQIFFKADFDPVSTTIYK